MWVCLLSFLVRLCNIKSVTHTRRTDKANGQPKVTADSAALVWAADGQYHSPLACPASVGQIINMTSDKILDILISIMLDQF